MSRGRTPRNWHSDGRASLRRAVDSTIRSSIEPLEERKLLTTLVGGQNFTYFDASSNRIRITLVGDITAEFLAARISPTNRNGYTANSAIIRDLIPPPPPTNAPPGYQGADLFNIYVAEAGPDAAIYISEVDDNGVPADPSSGNVGSPTVRETIGSNIINAIDDSGSVYIGARTIDVTPTSDGRETNVPILQVRNRNRFGVRPASKSIFAGLQTAPDVSLNKVLIAGTITGAVNIEGSVKTFYVGNILTGDAGGLPTSRVDLTTGQIVPGRSSITNNFTVAGDLQNLYVLGSVGTNGAATYRTGASIRVGGRLGYVHVQGAWSAQATVRGVISAASLKTPVQEQEYYLVGTETPGEVFFRGLLAQDFIGSNDGTDGTDAQFASTDVTGLQTMSWTGSIQSAVGDGVDSYSLPLMAGSVSTVELVTSGVLAGVQFAGAANVSVYDPLGRLIASDLPGPGLLTNAPTNQQFQFTADLPGVYTLAVAGSGRYILNATAGGEVTMGGAQVSGTTHFTESGNGVALRYGDLGAWVSQGTLDGTTGTRFVGGNASPINLSKGNLRALYAANIGQFDLIIPRGSVGYVKSGGDIALNPDAADSAGDTYSDQAVGGDYQRVEAAGDLDGNIVANGRIGTIIVGGINSDDTVVVRQPVISANTDQKGSDGTIDMIYVSGSVGSQEFGTRGPAIYNGLDGNIKYFHVGNPTEITPDSFFGSTLNSETTLRAGQSFNFVDDSGARAIITPTNTTSASVVAPTGSVAGTTTDPLTGIVTTIAPDPITGVLMSTTSTPGRLTYVTYGVRGVGGQLLVSLTSTTSFTVTSLTKNGQIDITDAVAQFDGGSPTIAARVNAAGNTGTVVTGTGADPVIDPVTGAPLATGDATILTVGYPHTQTDSVTDPLTGLPITSTTTVYNSVPSVPNQVILSGQSAVNLFNLTGATAGGTLTNLTSVINNTAGELVSVDANTIGTVIAQETGRIHGASTTKVIVPGNLINDPSDVQPFDAFSRGIDSAGSIISVLGRNGIGDLHSGAIINIINPNADGKNASGVNDGINGSIDATTLNFVNIGEGIAFGGSGTHFNAGLFALSAINTVTGVNADIRGPVISKGTIGTISLTNGSIINARIGTLGAFVQGQFTTNGVVLQENGEDFALNTLQILGDGGIIGSDILSGSFGTINVQGYGIIASSIRSTASGVINGSVVSSGFGIRSSYISTGTSVRSISATGKGRVLKVSDYNARVQQTGGARNRRFDAYSGRLLNYSNDLNRMFGTSRTRPGISGITNAGVIADTSILGNNTLGSLNAYAITSADKDSFVQSAAFPMRVTFAAGIGSINVDNSIAGVQIRSGKLDSMTVGNALQNAEVSVAGEIGTIKVGRIIRGNTTIAARNGNGTIGSIQVRGGLYATVTSQGQIGSIAAGVIGGSIASSAGITRIGVTTDVLTGSYIRARKTINRLIIGGNFEDGATIDADDIGVFRVGGENAGTIINH